MTAPETVLTTDFTDDIFPSFCLHVFVSLIFLSSIGGQSCIFFEGVLWRKKLGLTPRASLTSLLREIRGQIISAHIFWFANPWRCLPVCCGKSVML